MLENKIIYTSYFGKMKKFPDNFFPIAICQYLPKWYNGANIKLFAPSSAILNEYHLTNNKKIYTQKYLKQIVEIENIDLYINKIFEKCGDKIPVLLCYEKSNEFCHRHILSAILRIYGYNCKEWLESE